MGNNHKNSLNVLQQILIQPNIGLDIEVRQSVVSLLNITLADEVILTTKTRNAHWNVRGLDFFELHTLFETQYQLMNNICDELAERARMMGGLAIGSLQEFLDKTRLKEQPGTVPDTLHLLADHETSIRFLREDARKCSEDNEDEGTFDLLISIMRMHEKMAWMLRSFIENEPIDLKKSILS